MNIRLLVAVAGLCLAPTLRADDWPQFQGPDRSNVSKEKGLLDKWPDGGPKLLWTFDKAGVGYSTPAVVGDLLYITGADKTESFLLCVDVKAGKEKWRTKIGKRFTFKGNQWGDGPRAAPAVAGDLVIAMDGDGEVLCADAGTGKQVWRTNLMTNFKGEMNTIMIGVDKNDPRPLGWGYSSAPLVDGDQAVFQCGGANGALVALECKTGKPVWQSADIKDAASYAAVTPAEIGGVKQYVVLLNRGVIGVDAKTGKELWFHPRKYNDVLIPAPLVQGDHVYVCNGMDKAGCDLIKVTKTGAAFAAAKVYGNRNMKSINGGQALVDGHVFGASESGGWVCQDFLTGKVKWSQKNDLGPGTLTAADGHLYLYGEDEGEVRLIEASPAGWKEQGSFTIPKKTANQSPSGKKWTYPVVANGKLFLRDQELLFCYDIKKPGVPRVP